MTQSALLKKWWSWPRWLAFVISGTLLFLVFRRIDLGAFWQAIESAHDVWLGAAFLAYGVALWAASRRWHVALRVTRRATRPSVTYRMFLIGHFFFVALMGGVAGDLAKSAAYARWYRMGTPEVIASVPLDRCMGVSATLLLMLTTAALSLRRSSLEKLQTLHWHLPALWVVGGGLLLVAGILLVFAWRPPGETWWARGLRSLRLGAVQLVAQPGKALQGLGFALLAQAAWSSVLALCLLAVAPGPVPWEKLAWTFPVITALSAVPLTLAGAGVREMASLALLGLYGLPDWACIAAALLTLLQKLLWGGIGATVLWHEEWRFSRQPQQENGNSS